VTQRRAGLLLPFFSLRSARDWGVGDLGDLEPFCRWLASAGQSVLQLLPIAEMGMYETSPYGALTAFALDPLYLALDAVEDFAAAGGIGVLSPGARHALDVARGAPGIAYAHVRHAKTEALAAAFAHYEVTEAATGSTREAVFAAFVEAESWWLEEYVLFRALLDLHGEQPWSTWEAGLRDAEPAALRELRPALGRACRYHAWVQWLLAEQWSSAHRAAAAAGVRLLGDMPFMVSRESADVWARQREFRLDATIGAPPDAFSADGQDWGLPVMRWEAMAENGHAWWRARCRRAAALLDGIRLDHVIGYYRIYERPAGGAPFFQPADEGVQRALGEHLLAVGREAGRGLDLIGEDLGSVPEFVRHSLGRLDIPGFRVLRWEHDGGTFRDPRSYPEQSVATTGTHDTSSLVEWWEDELTVDQRAAVAAVPAFASLREHGDRLTPEGRAVLLGGVYGSASRLVILPFMDAYGGRDRINVPSTVAETNWTYRMPWTVDQLRSEPGAALAARLRDLAASTGRLP